MNAYYAQMRKELLSRCKDYWHGFYGNKIGFQRQLADLRRLRNWARS